MAADPAIRHPYHLDYKKRLESFATAPDGAFYGGFTKERLAEYGFFYRPTKEKRLINGMIKEVTLADKVTCFYCDTSLYNWQKNDDPLFEHRRERGDCKFMLNKLETRRPSEWKDYRRDIRDSKSYTPPQNNPLDFRKRFLVSYKSTDQYKLAKKYLPKEFLPYLDAVVGKVHDDGLDLNVEVLTGIIEKSIDIKEKMGEPDLELLKENKCPYCKTRKLSLVDSRCGAYLYCEICQKACEYMIVCYKCNDFPNPFTINIG